MKFVSYVAVRSVEEHVRRQWIRGVGKDAVFADVSDGWFIGLHGSSAAIYVGHEKPPFKASEKIRITMETVS